MHKTPKENLRLCPFLAGFDLYDILVTAEQEYFITIFIISPQQIPTGTCLAGAKLSLSPYNALKCSSSNILPVNQWAPASYRYQRRIKNFSGMMMMSLLLIGVRAGQNTNKIK